MAEDGKGVRYTHSTQRRESRLQGEGVYKVVQSSKETRSGHVGLENTMQTSLRGIANKAAQNKSHRFQDLYRLLSAEFLLWCWAFIRKNAASGVDRESACDYEHNLKDNTENWHKAIKDLSGTLRPGRYNYVVEADIKGFLDNIDHNMLLNMLRVRIDDKPLLKLIRRWLKQAYWIQMVR